MVVRDMTKDEFIAAYRATTYRLMRGDAPPIDLRIDQPSPELDAWLAAQGSDEAWFITAWNPQSIPQSDAANEAAGAELAQAVATYKTAPLLTLPDADGLFEAGLVILGIAEPDLLALADRYRQNAVLRLRRCHGPELVVTRWLG